MNTEKFSLLKRLKSFTYALNGLRIGLIEEHNIRIHFVAMLLAIILGLFLNLSTIEWVGIILSIGLVISLELLNSALENLADFGSKEFNELIKKSKDLAAASVFWSALMALIIGGLIFTPKLVILLE